ncbi:MAG: hypothetical protein QHJ73_03080, partial [Armatimonadota bacterium]|nr:hypothetical protein [Armatimonadota bacterium]
MEMPDAARFLRRHQIRVVRVEWCDLHGVARGKRVQANHFLEKAQEGFSFSSACMEMDLRGQIPWLGDQRLPWGNLYARPDLSTLHRVPFEPHAAAVVCDLFTHDGEPVPFSPREVLRRVLASAQTRGLQCCIGAELEFYLFQDDAFSLLPPGKLAYRIRNGSHEQQMMEALD